MVFTELRFRAYDFSDPKPHDSHSTGAIPIPGTKSPKRLEENAKVRFFFA